MIGASVTLFIAGQALRGGGPRTSPMAPVTTTALAPCAPSPPSVSVFFSRAWMLSIVFLQLMKRSKFSFTCNGAASKVVTGPAFAANWCMRILAPGDAAVSGCHRREGVESKLRIDESRPGHTRAFSCPVRSDSSFFRLCRPMRSSCVVDSCAVAPSSLGPM